MPTVHVRYFAQLREQRGCEFEDIDVPQGTTLAELYENIFPPGKSGSLPIAYAQNGSYVRGASTIQDGDEIVFIPPIGGG